MNLFSLLTNIGKKNSFVCYGKMLGKRPGMTGLIDWLEINHPEHISEKAKS